MMFLITGLTFSCLLINAQSQNFFQENQYYPRYQNPDQIYFPDSTNTATQAQPSADVLKQIFGESTGHKNAVEIQKSNEISASSTVELVTGRTPDTTSNRQVAQATVVSSPTVQPAPPSQVGYNGLLYSVTNFGVQLLKTINAVNSGNTVVSPFSITSLLALIQQGAIGQTRDQLTAVLQMNPANSASAYSQICADYKNRISRNTLKTANNIFVGDNFAINNGFRRIAQTSFDSDITPVSFARSDQAARQINSWVASRTDNKIEKLISPDAVDVSTQLVLVNAVYFKGLWEVPFRVESTIPREFQLGNGQIKTTPFMRMRRAIKSGIDPTTNARVILLPFEHNQYTLMVILPSTLEGITGTLRSLTDARLLSYLSFNVADIELELPKFTVRADTDLTDILGAMGLSKVFGQYAELDGLGSYGAFSPIISSALHSAVLSIDEHGGSAAAATSFAAVALSYDEQSTLIRVNRPFIAVLWDTVTSLPLFIAKIEEPTL